MISTRVMLGVLFLICGTITFSQVPLAGLVFFIPGLGLLFTFQSVTFDLTQQKVKNTFLFFGIGSGEWVPLRVFNYILISTGSYSSRGHSTAIYVVYLVPTYKNKDRSIKIFESFNLNKIKKTADKLSKLLNMEIKSNTKEWK